ncbi:MAG: DegT/DnrJ/EryC1/StrS family aminotransferase [Candidatus Roizmanbacteria bacterium]|nr:DegT/DnrJ/EryC1/StrS family aminotransferase [Candidatus Roizmanbacteria bacterium]
MIKLIKSTFYEEDKTKQALTKFITKAKILSFGPECIKFEENFSQYQKRKFTVFVNSGSSANLAIIQALLNLGRLKRGDLVGFSALTWSTNAMPLIELGLNAVPIDVELDTLNVSSNKLLEALKQYPIKALFITNLLGFCDDLEVIKDICKKRNILLIEDNCEALGSKYKNKLLGNFGLASTFSFYVGHHMSTIEGGAICTDDEELATMLKLVRAHGWDRNLSLSNQKAIRDKYQVNSTFYSRYTFYDLGYNFRPTEINGFIGNVQITYLDAILEKRNKNFVEVSDRIYKKTDLYIPIRYSHMDFHSNFAVPVICVSPKVRDELVKRCEGIVEIRPIVGGDMTQQPFFNKYMQKYTHMGKQSNADIIHKQGLYFGNNPELTRKEIVSIIKLFCTDPL